MSFRKPCHMPFRKLIPPFTLTVLESIFFAKQRLITRTSFVYKTLRLVRISLLINALNKGVLLFSGESYFIKAIENLFPAFAYPDINTRGVGRIRDSYASNSPNPSRVYIRLCKHGKRFLLLKSLAFFEIRYLSRYHHVMIFSWP